MTEDTAGKNPVKAVLGKDHLYITNKLAKIAVGAIMIAGWHNPDYYVKIKRWLNLPYGG